MAFISYLDKISVERGENIGQYTKRNINTGEKILREATISPVFLIISWIIEILFLILCFLLASKMTTTWAYTIMGFLLFIWGVVEIELTIKYFTTDLSITDRRIIGKAGFIRSVAMDVHLNKIQSVIIRLGFWGKIFNYGNVKISTAGSSMVFTQLKMRINLKNF